MNELQRLLDRVMGEYAEIFDKTPSLYCAIVWSRDREKVYADVQALARKAAKEVLSIEPLCVAEHFFKHGSETDSNLPPYFYPDLFTRTFYNLGIFFFVESGGIADRILLRKSSRSPAKIAALEAKRSVLLRPWTSFTQFASQAYPMLVRMDPFPFLPLIQDFNPNHLAHWKLAWLLNRLSLEVPDKYGPVTNCIGLGGGLPLDMHEGAVAELEKSLRPSYSDDFPRVVINNEDMVSKFRPDGEMKPREGWPLVSKRGNLVWQQPMLISVLHPDLLRLVQLLVKEVVTSQSGIVSLPVDAEAAPNVFHKDGNYFIIRFRNGKSFRLINSRGLGYVWIRLQYPKRPFSAEELMGYGEKPGASENDVLPNTISEFTDEATYRGLDNDNGYDEVTPEDRRNGSKEFKRLLSQVQQVTPSRAIEIREEMEWYRKHYGLTTTGELGILRKARTPAQKRKEAVSKAIKEALAKIKQHDPALASYLAPLAIYRDGKFDSCPTEFVWVVE